MSLEVKNLTCKYSDVDQYILNDISFSINEKDFVFIVGPTGSGKSTLLQCLTSLIKYEGSVNCDKDIRMVFQYPEYQFFENSVLKDVMYGAINKGLNEEEAKKLSKETLCLVGIDESKFDMSPYELSGGEKRRVAIASILVMQPDYLLLDEPASGLDPDGRTEILNLLKKLNESGKTIVVVSHSMEDTVNYAKKVMVLSDGKVVLYDTTKEVFKQKDILQNIGLLPPKGAYILNKLKIKGYDVDTSLLQFDEVKKCLETLL